VVIVDRRTQWGGNWVDQYQFLRLHQPYRHFTAGTAKWALKKPRSHLAAKGEVLNHFADVAARIGKRLKIEYHWNTEYQEYDEESLAAAEVPKVIVKLKSAKTPGEEVVVQSKKLIRAIGFNITVKSQGLKVTSKSVTSVGAADPVLVAESGGDEQRPIYIIGSGKTAMDVVYHLSKTQRADPSTPKRKIVMVAGRGTYFCPRELLFQDKGRWCCGGKLITDWMHELSQDWDGENHAEILKSEMAKGRLISAVPDPEVFQFGVLSRHEVEGVRQALTEVVKGRMKDVVDGVDGSPPMLVMASGAKIPIEKGAVLVNCTEHLFTAPNEPLLSPRGLVMSPQSVLIFPGPTTFYMTMLFYLNKLAKLAPKLHFVRWGDEPKAKLSIRMASVFLANLSVILFSIPPLALLTDRSNFNSYYPLHRQGMAVMRLLWRRSGILSRAQRLCPEKYGDKEPALQRGGKAARVNPMPEHSALAGGGTPVAESADN
jgi:hypothetical protein